MSDRIDVPDYVDIGALQSRLAKAEQRVADMTRALEAAKALHKFADEFCAAVDLAAEDIGGARNTMDILRDLGPATDAFERASAALASSDSK